MPKIHPSAVIEADASLADDVEVGPFCLIGDGVSLAAGVRLHSTSGRRKVAAPTSAKSEAAVTHTALGSPVDPDVYMSMTISSGLKSSLEPGVLARSVGPSTGYKLAKSVRERAPARSSRLWPDRPPLRKVA